MIWMVIRSLTHTHTAKKSTKANCLLQSTSKNKKPKHERKVSSVFSFLCDNWRQKYWWMNRMIMVMIMAICVCILFYFHCALFYSLLSFYFQFSILSLSLICISPRRQSAVKNRKTHVWLSTNLLLKSCVLLLCVCLFFTVDVHLATGQP